jgi:F420-dependent oxidoreductase-like protein
MQFGIHIASFTWPGGPPHISPMLAELARAADDGGIRSISVMDHFFQMGGAVGGADEPMLEGYTTLGFLAGITRAVHLHLLVTGVTYRHPGILAKTVSTLDVLSSGRAGLGIGAAWYEREHRGLGVPYPPVAERMARLEETLRIVLQMWSGQVRPFQGKYYQLAETLDSPPPLQRPHPPILIGGGGEHRTLRLVARYADACNLFAGSPSEVAAKLDVLRRHCQAEGTDYDRIEKTILWQGAPPSTAEAASVFVGDVAPYAACGIDRVIVMPTGPDALAQVRALGTHVVPRLAGLTA